MAEGVGADEDGVAGVDDALGLLDCELVRLKAGLTALYNAGDDGPDERHGEGVIDVEFEGGFVVVVAVVRQDVEEGSDEVEAFAGDVGDLEDGAYALAHELGGGLDCLVAVFDEDWDFPGAR